MDQEELERGSASLFQMHRGCQSVCFQLVYCENGEKDIPKLTETSGPSWLAPKRPSSIQKLFNPSKGINCQ